MVERFTASGKRVGRPKIREVIPYTEVENHLLTFMSREGYGHDITIAKIYDVLYPDGVAADDRTKQQYIGSRISRLNRKMKNLRIVPGAFKRTYRIEPT